MLGNHDDDNGDGDDDDDDGDDEDDDDDEDTYGAVGDRIRPACRHHMEHTRTLLAPNLIRGHP